MALYLKWLNLNISSNPSSWILFSFFFFLGKLLKLSQRTAKETGISPDPRCYFIFQVPDSFFFYYKSRDESVWKVIKSVRPMRPVYTEHCSVRSMERGGRGCYWNDFSMQTRITQKKKIFEMFYNVSPRCIIISSTFNWKKQKNKNFWVSPADSTHASYAFNDKPGPHNTQCVP